MNKYILGLVILIVAIIVTLQNSKKPSDISIDQENTTIGGDFQLIDSNGEIFSSKQLENKYSIVFFGFTHCPMICPTALGTLSALYKSLNEKEKSKLNIVFITLDPERDTAEYLNSYIENFATPFIALTGSNQEIKATADKYKIFYEKIPLADNNYTINHSTLIYIMSKNNKYITHFPYDVNSEEIYNKLKEII